IYGLLITIAIFVVSTFVGSRLNFDIEFIPHSFVTHSLMLILSIIMISLLRKHVNYRISIPQFKKILKPIIFGILATIVVNIFMTIITTMLGREIETHYALKEMSPLQVFLFVFIYASIAEEILFRGFLMNILKPLNSKGVKILKRNISVPVIISGSLFGLAHLILLTTGAGGFFLFRIVIFTTVLGVIAGYYQEKYNNNIFSIIVHMSGNLMSVIGAFLMSAEI
ncbi:MAG: hypothetical protein CR982_06590, partial [Candidatus Cloacimonadota bacterium]